MNKIEEQQQRHQATMTMLEKMATYVDQQLADDEERRELEDDYQVRRSLEKKEECE